MYLFLRDIITDLEGKVKKRCLGEISIEEKWNKNKSTREVHWSIAPGVVAPDMKATCCFVFLIVSLYC